MRGSHNGDSLYQMSATNSNGLGSQKLDLPSIRNDQKRTLNTFGTAASMRRSYIKPKRDQMLLQSGNKMDKVQLIE